MTHAPCAPIQLCFKSIFMEDTMIRVEHLSHRYSVQWAIRDINFKIPSRGIYGLLGSNGAGKSTTMTILCGVIKQTEGSVFIHGIDTRKDPVEAKKHIGFLPQKPPVYGDLTVEEYLTYCAQLRLMPHTKIKKAVDEVLELCAISHFRKRLIKNLSGGYQQRVGIAQAIVHKPEVVVFDEPTNGLDPNQILEIRHLIKNIAEDRVVILSTHILTEVQAVCDRIMMIEQGKLVFMGTVDEFDNSVAPNTIYLTLQDPPVVEELERVEGVVEVEELTERSFRIRFSDAQETIDHLVAASIEKHWHLSEIRIEKSSLDYIFAKFSKKIK